MVDFSSIAMRIFSCDTNTTPRNNISPNACPSFSSLDGYSTFPTSLTSGNNLSFYFSGISSPIFEDGVERYSRNFDNIETRYRATINGTQVTFYDGRTLRHFGADGLISAFDRIHFSNTDTYYSLMGILPDNTPGHANEWQIDVLANGPVANYVHAHPEWSFSTFCFNDRILPHARREFGPTPYDNFCFTRSGAEFVFTGFLTTHQRGPATGTPQNAYTITPQTGAQLALGQGVARMLTSLEQVYRADVFAVQTYVDTHY